MTSISFLFLFFFSRIGSFGSVSFWNIRNPTKNEHERQEISCLIAGICLHFIRHHYVAFSLECPHQALDSDFAYIANIHCPIDCSSDIINYTIQLFFFLVENVNISSHFIYKQLYSKFTCSDKIIHVVSHST